MIKKDSDSRPSERNRWMIHAVLGGGLDRNALSKVNDIIGGRASVFEVDELLVVASSEASEKRNEVALQLRIRDFSSLVNDLHRVTDILPFRFGVIGNSEELVRTVRDNQEWYRSWLKSIAGYTELNFRWAVAEKPGDMQCNPVIVHEQTGTRGFEYLKSKFISKQSSSQIERELRDIADDFGNRFRDQEMKWQSSVGKLNVKGSGSIEECYLIARVELLVRRETSLVLLDEGSKLLLRAKKPTVASGPWPPYSFIESGNVECFSHQMQRCAITFPNEAVS